MATPKRFIAGAVCPRCGEMDKLTMQQTEDGQFRECVACGFEDAQTPEGEPIGELATRVNKRQNTDDHTVKQVVFFKAAAADDDADS